MSELDELRRAGDLRIVAQNGYIRITSAKGIGKIKVKDTDDVMQKIETCAKRINRRYEKEYGIGK